MTIKRILYGIVKNGEEILVGAKGNMRFVPFGKVKARNQIRMYESAEKAQASIRDSWYLPELIGKDDKITIEAFEETLEMRDGGVK